MSGKKILAVMLALSVMTSMVVAATASAPRATEDSEAAIVFVWDGDDGVFEPPIIVDPTDPNVDQHHTIDIHFHEHDITDVLSQTGSVTFNSVRVRNDNWDPDRDNGDYSRAGLGISASTNNWGVAVEIDAFARGSTTTLRGFSLTLDHDGLAPVDVQNPNGPATLPGNATFQRVTIDADAASSGLIATGSGPFRGVQSFSGALNTPVLHDGSPNVIVGEAQASLTWTFVPDRP